MSQSITFFPKDSSFYQGSFRDIDSTMPREYLASLDYTPSGDIAKPGVYKFDDVTEKIASTRRAIEKAKILERKARHSYSPSIAREMAQLERSGALNDSSIEQLTIVQFVHSIIGQLDTANIVTRACTGVPTNSLRGKIPEGGFPSVSVQVDRLSEPKITQSDFGQTEFRIKRNDVHVYISREDRMEAAIDPYSFSTIKGQQQLLQTRELLFIKELENRITQSVVTIADPKQSANSRAPRAETDSAENFLKMTLDHYHKSKNQIKSILINPLDYRAHTSNYFIRNNIKVESPSGWGVVPFAGLENYGVTALISPWMPRYRAYALSGEAAYELNGPKIVDSEYDAKKFADYTPIRDFVGYLIANPARFCEKLQIGSTAPTAYNSSTNMNGLITTNAQIEQILDQQVSVEKSDNP